MEKTDFSKILTKEFLEKECLENKKFLKDIAKEVGCNKSLLNFYLKKLGIVTRDKQIDLLLTKEFLLEKYSKEGLYLKDISKLAGCSRSKVLNKLILFNIPRKEAVKPNRTGIDWTNKEERSSYSKESSLKNRKLVINYYGGECFCCKEDKYEFLSIDHINGLKREKDTVRWILNNNFPSSIRILCHNCNSSLGFYGYCPHNPEVMKQEINGKNKFRKTKRGKNANL